MIKDIVPLLKTRQAQVVLVLFVIVSCWWLWLLPSATHVQKQQWSAVYQILALFGFAVGMITFRFLGGFKSNLGKAIFGFSLGLLFQSFGQTSYSYYAIFKHIDVPYPSIGDIGFFATIPCYIYASIQLAKAAIGNVSLKSFYKIQILLIPLGILGASYWVFLKGYIFDWSNPVKIFLDFIYPLGEAAYVSIAILTLILSRKILGGAIKGPVVCLLCALIFQYISDYTFLYQASRGLWQIANTNDFMYAASYFLMALSIIYLGEMSRKVREMNVYGDRVVFTSTINDSSLTIENPQLADALRKNFNATEQGIIDQKKILPKARVVPNELGTFVFG